jgi:hypothetical protein
MRSALPFGLLLIACGPSMKQQAMREAQDFNCRERIASYVAMHHMGGDEVGVQMDCMAAGPRIKRWRMDKQGVKIEDVRKLTPGEFDAVWREIEGTGWQNQKDCGNGTGGKRDPIYTFDIKDDQHKNSFQCQSQTMPYPYNTIVDPMDVASQKGRKQLGDDEPNDLKKYDKRDKQK